MNSKYKLTIRKRSSKAFCCRIWKLSNAFNYHIDRSIVKFIQNYPSKNFSYVLNLNICKWCLCNSKNSFWSLTLTVSNEIYRIRKIILLYVLIWFYRTRSQLMNQRRRSGFMFMIIINSLQWYVMQTSKSSQKPWSLFI